MYLSDKIIECGEITQSGEFSINDGSFYLFLVPKTSKMEVRVLSGMLSQNLTKTRMPFIPNEWNPMVVKSVTIPQEVLNSYYVFWGIE